MFKRPDEASITLPFEQSEKRQVRYDTALKELQKTLGITAPKGLCVIDLTTDDAPVVVGSGVDTPLQIGSMAKLAVLYAVFQLREDLRAVVDWAQIARHKPETKSDDLLKAVKEAWSKSPSTALRNLSKSDQGPEIAKMFDLKAFAKGVTDYPELISDKLLTANDADQSGPDFTNKSAFDLHQLTPKEAEYPQKLRRWYDETLANQTFDKLVMLMMRWSDNVAATACVSRIGLPYIQAVLQHSGLYREGEGPNKNGTGLWLGGGYAPLPSDSKEFRKIGSLLSRPVEFYKTKDSTQVGTAYHCALLFAALVRRSLMPTGTEQMRAMLDYSPIIRLDQEVPPGYTFMDSEIRKSNRLKRYLSKIGVLGKTFSEAAYFLAEATKSKQGTQARDHSFVVAALNTDEKTLKSLGKRISEIIDKLNN